jgi:hypothetical protein
MTVSMTCVLLGLNKLRHVASIGCYYNVITVGSSVIRLRKNKALPNIKIHQILTTGWGVSFCGIRTNHKPAYLWVWLRNTKRILQRWRRSVETLAATVRILWCIPFQHGVWNVSIVMLLTVRRKRWHLANDAVLCCTLYCSLSPPPPPPAGLFMPFVSAHISTNMWGYQKIKQYQSNGYEFSLKNHHIII